MHNVYLIGYRASGKSTVSKILSKKIQKKVIHMDDELVKKIGPINDFVKKQGWKTFRQKESDLLSEVAKKDNAIIDCGGGIIEIDDNIRIMRSTGKCVFLDASAETIKERLSNDNYTRPSLSGKDAVDEVDDILERRMGAYQKASDITISVDDMNATQIADEIVKNIK